MSRALTALGLTLAGLLVLTIPFWIWPIDLSVERAFFDSERGGWFLHDAEPWDTLYHFGTAPALLFVLGSIAVLVLGFWRASLARWRKLAAYFILCLAVGPGLLVNAIFKDHWGRPRPREVIEFGGAYAHERVWEFDASSPGKSFPCGHCSMGFYFLALAFALRRRRFLASAAAGGAVVLGAAVGMARVVQGGHFLSDLTWAGGFCLLTSIGLFYALRLDRSLWLEPKPKSAESRRPPLWTILAGTALGIGAVAGVLLATPYSREGVFEANLSGSKEFELSLELVGTTHRVSAAESEPGIAVSVEGEGFGLPGSAVKERWKDEPEPGDPETRYIQLKQRRSGWFSELKHETSVRIPAAMSGFARIRVESGDLELDLSPVSVRQTWKIEVAEPGVVRIRRPSNAGAAAALKLEIEGHETPW